MLKLTSGTRSTSPARRSALRGRHRLLLVGAPLLALSMPGVSMAAAILGIGFLIFIHEWGHFTACRLTGTRTETFSVGFGPRLFGWEKDREGIRRFTVGQRQLDPEDHAMDFRIALIPLGGYVKMAGEIPGEGTSGAADEFPQKTALQRAFIISAGVIMNLITAIVFYGITYGGGLKIGPPVVGSALEGRPAWRAGMRPGDRVLEMSGSTIESDYDMLTESALSKRDEPVRVTFERDGTVMPPVEIQSTFDEAQGRMLLGWSMGRAIELGEGASTLRIGAAEPATVAGIPVTGGSEASLIIDSLVRSGTTRIEVATAEGRVTLEPKPPEGEVEAPAKVGLGVYAPLVVKEVRGQAEGTLQAGDRIDAVVLANGRSLPIASRTELVLARTAPSAWRGLRIARGDETDLSVELELPTPAAVQAFLADVAFESPTESNAVRPLAPGQIYIAADGATLVRAKGAPALEAGVKVGERLVRVGDTEVKTFQAAVALMAEVEAGASIQLTLASDDGTERQVEVTAQATEVLGALPIVGVHKSEVQPERGVLPALGAGLHRTWREARNVFRTIGAFFTGRVSFGKNVAGPIRIIGVSKDFAESGWLPLLWFLAYVSVMLAVLNILPIPILDGGHLLFILIEKIKGKPLSDATMINLQKVGMLLLLTLMFFAFKNDLTWVFSGK